MKKTIEQILVVGGLLLIPVGIDRDSVTPILFGTLMMATVLWRPRGKS